MGGDAAEWLNLKSQEQPVISSNRHNTTWHALVTIPQHGWVLCPFLVYRISQVAQHAADLEYYVHWSRHFLASICRKAGVHAFIWARAVTHNHIS